MTARAGFSKVVVDGRIRLGEHIELVQGPRPKPADVFGAAGAGSPRDFDARAAKDGDALGDVLEFRLSDHATGDLYIEGSGLVNSFGIFGAPGSGKTNLLLHLLGQVLGNAREEPERRYGALILDPKAALVDAVTRMADRTGRAKDLVVINTTASKLG